MIVKIPRIGVLTKSVTRPSETFNQVLKIAVSNAAGSKRNTVTVNAMRDIAKYRLKYCTTDSAAVKAELKRMSTLRGVINSSKGMFGRNGRLAEWAKFKINDLIRGIKKFQSMFVINKK